MQGKEPLRESLHANAISEEEFRSRWEAKRAQLLWPFKALGVLLLLAFVVAFAVLAFWALITAIRWLWEHPLWS